MRRPKTLPAFTTAEFEVAHALLATRVAFMMGRKLEEGDWAEVYCRAKNIPEQKWSNLNIDIMHGALGVEHKIVCRESNKDITESCGLTLMHPSATRQIRPPSTDTDPIEAMRDVLGQYAALIRTRGNKVRENAGGAVEPDMRTGWLLWQESLRQFLYFEEEMLPPSPEDYTAIWNQKPGGGTRRGSKNLWIFEKETGIKRYSITTEAGAKVQPYFDVPTPTDPNLYVFTVIGESIAAGFVRVWVTEGTARELRALIGNLDTEAVSRVIIQEAARVAAMGDIEQAEQEAATRLVITAEAYKVLRSAFPKGKNDDHSFQLLAQHMRHDG